VIDFSSEVSSTISNRVHQPRSTSFSAVDGVTHAILPLVLSIQTLSIQICNKLGISIPALNGIAGMIPIERINGIIASTFLFPMPKIHLEKSY